MITQLFKCGCRVEAGEFSSKLGPCEQHAKDSAAKQRILDEASRHRKLAASDPLGLLARMLRKLQ